jgi:hypothetical protein
VSVGELESHAKRLKCEDELRVSRVAAVEGALHVADIENPEAGGVVGRVE